MSWISKLHKKNLNVMGPAGDRMEKHERNIRNGLGMKKSNSKSGGGKSSKSSGSSKKKKKKHEGGSPQRSTLAETRDAIAAAREAYPAALGLSQQYDGEFAKQEADTARVRAGEELKIVRDLGPQYSEAVKDGSPEIRASADLMKKNLDQAGPSAIETELTKQAQNELAMGGALSADETREAVQGERQAWAARGTLGGQPAVTAEVMARAGMSERRKEGRRAFAAGVDGARMARVEGDRAYGINALNASVATFDPRGVVGKGGSAVTGVVQGATPLNPYGALANQVGAGNQDARLRQIELESREKQATLDREAGISQFDAQRADSMASAAAARKSNMTGALIGAGGAVAMGLIIF